MQLASHIHTAIHTKIAIDMRRKNQKSDRYVANGELVLHYQ